MKIASARSVQADEDRAAGEAYEALFERLKAAPQLILVHSSCAYFNEKVIRSLRRLAPAAQIQGGTSCLGVMTEAGFHSRNGLGLGLLGVLDPEGAYGVGISEFTDNVTLSVNAALTEALQNAGRPGELPAAVVLTGCPGEEEKVIRAIEAYFGSDVPIIGGTSADNDMSGRWQQFGNDRVYRRAVSIAVIYPTGSISCAFHSGYEPTSHHGRVTRAHGRMLQEIDGRPAGRVYREWTEGLIDTVWPGGGSLVPTTSFHPIGRPVDRIGGVFYHRLSYPVALSYDHGLELFTDIHEGDEVVLMTGTPESLITRAGRVAGVAVEAADFGKQKVEGALVLFCTGCMLSVRDGMSQVIAGIREGLGKAPFLGTFTLGEQGCFIGGENRHGNLMVATIVFGPRKVA